MAATADAVRHSLKDVQFPATRDDIVRSAEQRGAPEDVVQALRAMPPVEYANKDEVVRSAHIPAAPEQDPATRAAQARDDHQRIAQHLRDTDEA